MSSKILNELGELIAVLSRLPVVRKAFSAIDWSVRVWPERYLCLFTTVRADCSVHFLRTTETSAVVVSSPEGISSVIKTHFCFTSAYSGFPNTL
jgi:hypothetical protein